eukprot:1149498-Pelagomonas_calceolata.AAC.7
MVCEIPHSGAQSRAHTYSHAYTRACTQVAAQAEEIAGMQASIKDNSHTASQLEHGITDLRRMAQPFASVPLK